MKKSKLLMVIFGLCVQSVAIVAGPVFSKKFKEGFGQGCSLIFTILEHGVGKTSDTRTYLINDDNSMDHKLQTIRQTKTLGSYEEDSDIDLAMHINRYLKLLNKIYIMHNTL